MSWKCPDCKKTFKNKNQWHSCVKYTVADHFEGKDPSLKAAYDIVEAHVKSLGKYDVNPVKSCILLKTDTNFLEIKLTRKAMSVSFSLDHPEDEFPVVKVLHYSKNRYLHTVKLDHPDEVDRQLLDWISEAYALANTKS